MTSEAVRKQANSSAAFANWLAENLDGLSMPGSERHRIAGACLNVSLDHHTAVVSLVRDGRFASASALLRPQVDSFLRAEWVAYVASESDLENVKQGGDPPGAAKIAELLERADCYDLGLLTDIRDSIWPTLCDFTHCGIRTIVRHLSNDEIAPQFDDEEILDILGFSDGWAGCAAVAIAALIDDEALADRILSAAKAHHSRLQAAASASSASSP